MNRRKFIQLSPLLTLPFFQGCGLLKIDPWSPLIRSERIHSLEVEKQISSKAKLMRTLDGKIRVLFVRGDPYERGYQHGVLLRKEVEDNLGYIYNKALSKFHFQELFFEVYERLRPFIPQEHIDEMHGLAHGAKIPLHLVQHMHILPEIGEWGGKKKISKMMKGELGTSCSNFAASHSATIDQKLYAVRILDWGLHRISKLHDYPLITVGIPESGFAYANIGWVGFLGAVSGMNEKGITLGEMGYKDPPNETLSGTPMPFVLRDVLTYSENLADVRKVITDRPGTCSFVFLMTDGKTKEAEIYVRDRDRFVVFKPGVDLRDRQEYFPAIKDVAYGGHFEEIMEKELKQAHGSISPELLMQEIIPKMVMKSNFQNILYLPEELKFWVNNAKDRKTSAQNQPYTLFDFGAALAQFREGKFA
jgi:isopenicillin-N N-acyltransferase like protein